MRKLSAKERRRKALHENGYTLDGIDRKWFEDCPFVCYDPASGEILESGRMSEPGIDLTAERTGRPYLKQEGHWATHYVRDGIVRKKRRCLATADGTTLRNLPVPCKLEIRDGYGTVATHDVDEDTAELDFEHPGTYRVVVKSVPYLAGDLTVTVK
jgi:hypothetical protein